MNERLTSLQKFLSDCVRAAQMPGTACECEVSQSVDTESESTNLSVRFDKTNSTQASIDLRALLSRLEADTVLGAVDLVAMPQAQLVILGAQRSRNYKILIHL